MLKEAILAAMRITQWGEYGILISIHLARQGREGVRVVSAAEIAEAQGIALQYTQQILLRLREGGVVESVRGPRGGFRLARPASELSLLDILLAAEGDTLEIICEQKPLSEARCATDARCLLRPVWYGLRDVVNSYLEAISVESLAEDGGQQTLVKLGLGADRESEVSASEISGESTS